MHKLEDIQRIVAAIEADRVPGEVVRELGVDASPQAAHRSMYPVIALVAIVTLGIISAVTALAVNFLVVVWVFHIAFE